MSSGPVLGRSIHAGAMCADQLASAFGDTALHSYGNTAYRQGGMRGDDFIDPMWFAAGVVLRTTDLIAKTRDGFAVDIMHG